MSKAPSIFFIPGYCCKIIDSSILPHSLDTTLRFGLVGRVLWHINLCRLSNAKSIFM